MFMLLDYFSVGWCQIISVFHWSAALYSVERYRPWSCPRHAWELEVEAQRCETWSRTWLKWRLQADWHLYRSFESGCIELPFTMHRCRNYFRGCEQATKTTGPAKTPSRLVSKAADCQKRDILARRVLAYIMSRHYFNKIPSEMLLLSSPDIIASVLNDSDVCCSFSLLHLLPQLVAFKTWTCHNMTSRTLRVTMLLDVWLHYDLFIRNLYMLTPGYYLAIRIASMEASIHNIYIDVRVAGNTMQSTCRLHDKYGSWDEALPMYVSPCVTWLILYTHTHAPWI